MINPFVSARKFISFMRGDHNDKIISNEEGILNLTRDNFDRALAQNRFLLVKFYVPSCPRCKNFEPEYSRVNELLRAQQSEVKLAQVDAKTEEALARQHKVAALPALRLFTNNHNSPILYYGMKKAEPILAWINKTCTNC